MEFSGCQLCHTVGFLAVSHCQGKQNIYKTYTCTEKTKTKKSAKVLEQMSDMLRQICMYRVILPLVEKHWWHWRTCELLPSILVTAIFGQDQEVQLKMGQGQTLAECAHSLLQMYKTVDLRH